MAENNSSDVDPLDGGYEESANQLEQFRQEWHAEVAEKKKNNQNVEKTTENAVNLYYRGVQSERDGQMNSAIQFYRQAIHIDPNVEDIVAKMDEIQVKENSSDCDEDQTVSDSDLQNGSLVEIFSNILSKNEIGVEENDFLNLPAEVLCLIIRWVASSDLDMKSVEGMSETCRKLYVYSRDVALWKAACEKVWGPTLQQGLYVSWRNMFIEKPRILCNGVYISLVTYFFSGDSCSLSPTYKPYHCVEYYRYMRFFSNGKMILYTTPETPTTVIPNLIFENAQALGFRVGRYKMHTESPEKSKSMQISADLQDSVKKTTTSSSSRKSKRQQKQELKYVVNNVDYHIELELTTSSRKNRNNKLTWLLYSCYYKFDNPRSNYAYKVPLQEQYPPLYFSQVKSYNSVSVAPL